MNFHLDGEAANLIVNGPAQGWELPPPHLDATITGVETAVWPKPDMTGYKYPPLIEFRAELLMTAGGEVLKSKLGS